MVTVEPLVASMPQLAGTDWAILRAHARAVANRFVIASSHAGTAVAVEELHSRERRVWVVHVPGEHNATRATGVRTREGQDRAATAKALLAALRDAARVEGIGHLVVARAPVEDRGLAEAAHELGGKTLPAPPDHLIQSPGGFADHLKGLGTRRAWKLRNDLERAAEVGAELVTVSPPDTTQLASAWPLVRSTLERKQSRLIVGDENLLALLATEAPEVALTLLRIGDRLMGALVAVRSGEDVQFAYLGRVADPPLHVSAALWSFAVRAELERGAPQLLLGMTGEVLKRRLGARPIPQVHYHLSCVLG